MQSEILSATLFSWLDTGPAEDWIFIKLDVPTSKFWADTAWLNKILCLDFGILFFAMSRTDINQEL